MKTLLVGNGINIEFGGMRYLNYNIVDRLFENLSTKDYSQTFGGMITNNELKAIIEGYFCEIPKIMNGHYDRHIRNAVEQKAIEAFRQRYIALSDVREVGLEDFFLIMRLHNNSYGEPVTFDTQTAFGLYWLFLDAIYDDGKIQKVYELVSSSKRAVLKEKLQSYSELFTVNYDNTLEKLAESEVKYLHGDFETLSDQYDVNKLTGYVHHVLGKENPVNNSNRHMYCNAVFGFSGVEKSIYTEKLGYVEKGMIKMKQMIERGFTPEEESKIKELENSSDEKMILAYHMIRALQSKADLKCHRYPFNEFELISGTLDVVGLSPYNDEHIWQAINDNEKLESVTFYYKGGIDQEYFKTFYPDIEIEFKPVELFW